METFPTIAKDQQLLSLAYRDLRQQRQQVVRHTLRILTHDPTGMASRRVEVPQQRSVPLLASLARLFRIIPLRIHKIRDHILHRELRVPIRIRRSQRTLLGDGYHVLEPRRVAVHRRGAREDDVRDMMLLHAAQQAQRAVDIHAVVIEWDLARLAHGLERGEVDDIVDVRVVDEDLVELGLVGDVAGVGDGPLAADELDAVERFGGGVVEVVDDDDLIVGFEEGEGGEGADVARATGGEPLAFCRCLGSV